MLVSIFSSELLGNSPGLSRNNACWLSADLLQRAGQCVHQPLCGCG